MQCHGRIPPLASNFRSTSKIRRASPDPPPPTYPLPLAPSVREPAKSVPRGENHEVAVPSSKRRHAITVIPPSVLPARSEEGGTVLGTPDRVVKLGESCIPYNLFLEYLLGLGESSFSPGTYNLLKHNCNNFSNEVAQFLCGSPIPKYILDLPDEVLSTPLGQTLRPLLEGLSLVGEGSSGGIALGQVTSSRRIEAPSRVSVQREASPDLVELNTAIEAASSAAVGSGDVSMADAEASNGVVEGGANGDVEGEPRVEQRRGRGAEEMAAEMEAEERKEREAAKRKQRDPPIVFKDAVDVRVEFDALVGHVGNLLNPEEQQSLEELHQYMLEDEGSWALSDSFLNFVGRLLHDTTFRSEARLCMLKVLASAALKDDVILLLHQDRREHVLMNYAHGVDRLPVEEQLALTLLVANLFENLSSSEWLLYISEWELNGQTISNIRVTTKVAVNALLSQNDSLRDRGSAIIHNLACKEVFDDVAVELTMALLEFFSSGSRDEELLYRCFKALQRFCTISQQDVPQLIQMIGPPPSQFRGVSERIDNLIIEIERKLR
ncbi:uncharacterized protein LOC124154661 isoform X2 [Ischnura elegans]|uniref:uncharacterized protein LOC124154661 isoform X2 n=1 Tax=Ischnura elegans TaxID=197161 RepID=UPI001ED880CB|nr:uncharacterized protein LOC124154661 isoform X2 [Ischnura elegans]